MSHVTLNVNSLCEIQPRLACPPLNNLWLWGHLHSPAFSGLFVEGGWGCQLGPQSPCGLERGQSPIDEVSGEGSGLNQSRSAPCRLGKQGLSGHSCPSS